MYTTSGNNTWLNESTTVTEGFLARLWTNSISCSLPTAVHPFTFMETFFVLSDAAAMPAIEPLSTTVTLFFA